MADANARALSPYIDMISIEQWSHQAQLPKPLRATMEALLIEMAAYFGREVVYRRELDAGEYVFSIESLDHAWRAVCGTGTENERLAHGIHALLLYHRLRAGSEWLTLDQFFDAAGPGVWTAKRAALREQLSTLYETSDGQFGAPPHFVEYDPEARTRRSTPTLPRCFVIGLLYGDLESSLPAL